jgi:NAD(P)-dependent dehydrogenase (short-subunit alcohol dehydrogenase family)
MKINGKVFLLTGAGGGIGRAMALLLLAKGARVAGADVNASALSQTKELAGSLQENFFDIRADITDRATVEKLPEQVRGRFGAIDGVINNAGIIQPFVRLNDLDYAAIERVLDVNLFGTLYIVKVFLPYLLQRQEAHIVNVSSMGGFVPVPGQTMYCAAKASVKLLSEGLASELMDTNVRVTVVFPGAIATDIKSNSGVQSPERPSKPSGAIKPLDPKRAADIIVRGVERNCSRIFVGFDSKLMDKLYRLSPRLASSAIARSMSGLLEK